MAAEGALAIVHEGGGDEHLIVQRHRARFIGAFSVGLEYVVRGVFLGVPIPCREGVFRAYLGCI